MRAVAAVVLLVSMQDGWSIEPVGADPCRTYGIAE